MHPAGKLRHRIRIQKLVDKDSNLNEFGLRSSDESERWTDVDEDPAVSTTSAQIEELRGTEADLARQNHATATHRIRIRFRRNFTLTTKHSFLFGNRRFNIGHIGNVDQVNCIQPILCDETKP